MVLKLISKLLGDQNEKEIKKLDFIVEHVNSIEEEYQRTLKAEDIPKKTAEFQARLAEYNNKPAEVLQEALDNLLPEAFALVKFACRTLIGQKWKVRDNETEWNMIPYDVQIKGAIVLHQGKIAEMKTGEGKTLMCTMPVYLNALTQKGVHVVTVNDYLAKRDAEWMGGVYQFMGLSIGIIQHGQKIEDKKAAYEADITYGTNNEFGFDFLRSNMAKTADKRVQRKLNYAIVDEVDSILIDEARTPLIISAPAEQSTEKYQTYSKLVGQLEENTHYNIDEKAKTAILSEEGITKMESLLGIENIYTDKGFEEVHHIEQALKSKTVYKKDTDYVVKEGQVMIVDEFTGRLMPGRRFSKGLHQAIEAKEGVEIKRESKTLATITFQNYFRIYTKLAGMTGTAITEAEEFAKIYGLETLVIPTNKPITRKDLSDVVYKNTQGKYMAIAKKVKELNAIGQPVLIGTVSVGKSEMLSKLLTMQGIKHKVLNAKHHEQEAEIVANAGSKNAVTIATNMAGRGTDIKLTDEVVSLGGLYVIGTERHESRRIDNQLRGRSGRQGDAGTTQFYISMDDDIMRLFGSERMQGVMEKMGVPDDMPIENRIISKSIESAQKKVEGRNFDIRKHLVEYDDTMNKHRELIYERRDKILDGDNIQEFIQELINKEANDIVMSHAALDTKAKWDYKEMAETLTNLHHDSIHSIKEEELKAFKKSDELVEISQKYLQKEYEAKEKTLKNSEIARHVERVVTLKIMDTLWMEHINAMTKLRQNVALRGYGQKDPLIEYKNEGYTMFIELNKDIQKQIVNALMKIKIKNNSTETPFAAAPVQKTQTNAAAIQGNLTDDQMKRIVGTKTSTFATATSGPSTSGSTLTTKKVEPASKEKITVVSADTPTPEFEKMKKNVIAGMPKSTEPAIDMSATKRNDPCPCGNGKKFKKCCGQ
jgi:preprotein translocase subunit SecA